MDIYAKVLPGSHVDAVAQLPVFDMGNMIGSYLASTLAKHMQPIRTEMSSNGQCGQRIDDRKVAEDIEFQSQNSDSCTVTAKKKSGPGWPRTKSHNLLQNKALSENGKTHLGLNPGLISEKIPDLRKHWDSLTELEQQLIMKLIKN